MDNVSEFKKNIDIFNFNKDVLERLLDILVIVFKTSNQTIILILAQNKSANVSLCKRFFQKINNYFIQNKHSKLV